MSEFNVSDVRKYLEEKYPLGKLRRMGGTSDNQWRIRELYLIECIYDNKLVTERNLNYVLDAVSGNLNYDESLELLKFILNKFEVSHEKKKELFKKSASNTSGFSGKNHPVVADMMFEYLTDEDKDKMAYDSTPDEMWGNSSKDALFLYLHKKGVIHFNGAGKNDYSRYIKNMNVESLKSIKFKVTDTLIKSILTCRQKSFEHKLKYLFTVPQFREKVIDDEKWMLHEVGSWGKFIDYYPEEEKQKYIKKLMEERKANKKLKTQ